MKTKFEGLWKTRKAVYVSKPFTQKQLKELPKKFRLVVRYNKFYQSDTARPKFVFSFMDAEEAEAFMFEFEEGEDEDDDRQSETV